MIDHDIRTMTAWFDDAELRRRLGGYLPLDQWYAAVCRLPEHLLWMADDGSVCVGHIAFEIDQEEQSWVAVVVNPSLRGRGYCVRLWRALLAQSEVARVRVFRAEVEQDNVASLRCLAAAGFVPDHSAHTEPGFIAFRYERDVHGIRPNR
jgi:RimJ/RimL family protein N-acetyltransferase